MANTRYHWMRFRKQESDNNVVTLESGFLKREFVFDGTTLTNEDDKINLTKIDEK